MKKRFLALFLVLCMALAALPAALAEESDALISEAVDAEVAAANETGVDGLAMDDGGSDSVAGIAAASADQEEAPAIAAPEYTDKSWQHLYNGWRYYYDDGSYPMGQWERINRRWYYFNSSGYMVTGWLKQNNKWYYLSSNGTMYTGWLRLGSVWYYLDSSGIMRTGWLQQGGKWYYFNTNGVMLCNTTRVIDGISYKIDGNGVCTRTYSGWQNDGRGWWYRNSDGSFPKNTWKQIDGKWYRFDPSGYMHTGWVVINGKYYYFDGAGVMQTGWLKNNGKWYYMGSSGAMQTGRITMSGKSYFFKSDGSMACAEWAKEDGDIFYYDGNGVYQSGVAYSGSLDFLLGCNAGKISHKVDPALYYSDGEYASSAFTVACDKNGRITAVQMTADNSYSSRNHIFGVRPGMDYSSAQSKLKGYGFDNGLIIDYVGDHTYKFTSDRYPYPVYLRRTNYKVEYVIYGYTE